MKHNKAILLTLVVMLIYCGAAFAQQLSVDGDIDTLSLSLTPFPTASQPAPSSTDGEAKIYYDTDDNQLYISENSSWGSIAVPKNVATIIVAASDSLTPSKADAVYQCDGIADQDTINDAITACAAIGGGAVYLLEGTYNISASINITSDNISLIGAGAGTVLQVATDATNVDVINAAGVSRILISQLMIDGNNNTGSNNVGIYFANVNNSKIDSLWLTAIKSMGGMSPEGVIYFNNTSVNNIISCNYIYSNDTSSSYAIRLGEDSINNIISENYIKGNRVGISLDSSGNIISNNNVENNALVGFYLNGAVNNTIVANIIRNNDTNGIWLLLSSVENNISNNVIKNNSMSGIVLFSSCDRNIISGNSIYANTQHGIALSGSSNNIISGNIIKDNDFANSAAYDGISIQNSSDYNLVSSNRLMDNDNYQINIESGAFNYLVGNHTYGTDYEGEIKDSGTNTKYTGKEKITLEPVTIDLALSTDMIDPSFGDDAESTAYPGYYHKGAPSSHIILNNTSGGNLSDVAMENGKAAGDLLILEGGSADTVEILDSASNVNLSSANCTIGLYDTLELIWNGIEWLEISRMDYP